jgi:hypothetical protein
METERDSKKKVEIRKIGRKKLEDQRQTQKEKVVDREKRKSYRGRQRDSGKERHTYIHTYRQTDRSQTDRQRLTKKDMASFH